jgi:hypothetical protein
MHVAGSGKIYAKNKFGLELANQQIYYDDICTFYKLFIYSPPLPRSSILVCSDASTKLYVQLIVRVHTVCIQ